MRPVTTLAFLLLLGSTAHAGLPHEGLMLRFGVGFGVDIAGDSDGETTVTIGGPSGALAAAVGYYVTPNLALNADLWFSATPDPEVTISDDNGNELTVDGEGTMSFFALGAGVTYWISSIDLYFSGSLGLGQATFSSDDAGPGDDTFSTDWGLAGKFGVGKQWAVGPEWGLGVSGQLTLASLQDDDSDEAALFLAIHALFTVTFH